jgi:hypothetical protein
MTQIFIFAFNRPDLLELQVRCLKKFLLNDFIINVVHDTRNDEHVVDFINVCQTIKETIHDSIIYHQHTSPEGLSSSEYHCKSLQWVQDSLVEFAKPSICLFLDHDLFLIDDLDLVKEMKNVDIMGLKQTREHIHYIWPGLVAFKSGAFKTIDWSCKNVESQQLDTGGGTYTILREENICYKDTGVVYPDKYKDIDLKNPEVNLGFEFEIHFDKFLHSRNACNWDVNYKIRDNDKTNLLVYILNDVLISKTKRDLEIVVSRYNEDLNWLEDYKSYCTIYNKGEPVEEFIQLNNIGREGHTFIHHIVSNYENLADYTMFLQGNPFNPHSPNLFSRLNHFIETQEPLPNFQWISERIVESDFEYIREPYHSIFPNIKFAFEQIFKDRNPPEKFRFGAGAQFMVYKELIHQRPKEFYENILQLFEETEQNEISLKLLGNPGISETFLPVNPELGLHLERFWGLIFQQT